MTGHKYETIGRWLTQAADHAAALSGTLVGGLHLSTVAVDEFGPLVARRSAGSPGATRRRWATAWPARPSLARDVGFALVQAGKPLAYIAVRMIVEPHSPAVSVAPTCVAAAALPAILALASAALPCHHRAVLVIAR